MWKSSRPGSCYALGGCTMAPRLQLHDLLAEMAEHVYYQPPNNMTIEFPCVLYARDDSFSEHADNRPYIHAKRYQLTVVDRNPDSPLPDQVEALPLCSFDRAYAMDELNHWVFNLYF